MPLPTWNSEPVEQGSTAMVEAFTEAWAVLQNAMGGAGLRDRPAAELLHAVEAAAWVERVAEAGRHLLVPIAKINGASWAELAAAMGVTRASAQQRHQQAVADWEADIHAAAEWAEVERGVEPLAPTNPPENFHPNEDDFVRMDLLPAWEYTGSLDPALQWLRAHHSEVSYFSHKGVHYVSSRRGIRSSSTNADSEEQAWRVHLGGVLLDGLPFPDDARPGETAAQLRTRLDL